MDIRIQPDTKGAKPQMPLEPPKEVKEMTFAPPPPDFFDQSSTTITTDNGTRITETTSNDGMIVEDKEKPKAGEVIPAKKEDAPIIPPKKDETIVPIKKDEKKEEPKAILKPPTESKPGVPTPTDKKNQLPKEAPIAPPAPKDKDEFDYTGYSPQEATNLKNMSRQSRDWVASLVKDKKALEPLKDSTYLQHEQAYTLNPEYQDMTKSVQLAQLEGNFWREQLLKIKVGKPFRDLQGFKPDGTPMLSEERQPTDSDELRVANNYSLCTQETQRRFGKLQEYPNQFKSRIASDLGAISQKQAELFAWVQNPTLMDHSVEIEGRGDVSLKDLKKDFISLIPAYLQKGPIADLASNMFIALQIRNAELREARKTGAVGTIQNEEANRVEPTSQNAPSQEQGKNGKIPSTFGMTETMLDSLGIRL
jgi:hypothetical protein